MRGWCRETSILLKFGICCAGTVEVDSRLFIVRGMNRYRRVCYVEEGKVWPVLEWCCKMVGRSSVGGCGLREKGSCAWCSVLP